MQIPTRLVVGFVVAVFAAACTTTHVPFKKDGDLTIPADYKSWPKFLSAVQRPDAKQVREIYMSPNATAATPAAGFPDGTMLVMENYAAQANADGSLKTDGEGKLVKGDLLRVFVMGKNHGWGQDVIEPLRNGNWIYTSYTGAGSKGPEDLNSCRVCHAPLTASKDFVHRFEEHFAQR
jgi:hypothetical protein